MEMRRGSAQDRTRRASQCPPSYDQILDDLDDDKDLTFAHIQTDCACQFRHTKERHSDPPHRADTTRATPRTTPVKPEQYNKYKRQGGNDLAVFLCNTFEQHGEQPGNFKIVYV